MKLKHILPACLVATLTLGFTACSDSEYEVTQLSEVQVSQSYVSIDTDGGSTSITVNAKDSWTIDASSAEDWLTITPTSGGAGESTVTFSAESTQDGRSATVTLECDGATQYINVIQGTTGVTVATCAEVIAGPDAKTFQVTGTVTAIANTTYGNFYLEDETGSIYIYGLMVNGSYPNGTMPFDVGDEVTVSGPKSTYGTTVELVDAELISVTKSLISVDSVDPEDATLPKEGGEFIVTLACSGDGATVDIPEDAEGWLSIKSIVSSSSEVVVTFKAEENTGGDRSTTITFYTTSDGTTYSAETTLTQEGSIMEVSIADFNAAETGATQYRITGYISSIYNAAKGRFYVKDYSGETYVYNMDGFEDLGLKEYDMITLVGLRDQYGETIEMTSAYAESSTVVTPITVSDFRNLDDDKTAYYLLTGTVTQSTEDNTKFDLDTYGNFALTDETGSVYVYGVSTGVGGASGQFGTLGVAEGDELTIICYKTSYNGLIEAGGSMYVAHTAAE